MKRSIKGRVAWAISAVLCYGAARADGSFEIGAGVHVGQNRNSLSATRNALSNAGLTFRDEVMWSRIEVQKGTLTYPASLNDLEQLVNDAVSRKHPPILILDYGNKFYGDGELVTSPEGIAAFCRYAAFVVKHFAGRVTDFEVWNEWNIGQGVHPLKNQSAASYVNLLQAAYKSIKAANPNAKVLGPVMNGLDQNWIDAFGKAGGFAYLDGFSVHPYEFWYAKAPKPPSNFKATALRTVQEQAQFATISGTPEAAIGKLDKLKAQIDAFAPGRDLSVYVTEIGWPTNQGQFGSSEAQTAAYVQRFLSLARTRKWLAGVWWYDLFDDGGDATNKEHRYGLLHQDGSPKPAYNALLELKDVLRSPGTFTEETHTDGTVIVSGKRSDGKNVKIAWVATNDVSGRESSTLSASALSPSFRAASGSTSGATQISGAPTLFVEQ